MTGTVLKLIDDILTANGIMYEFGEKTPPIKYPYFVGTYTDSGATDESGLYESDLTLDGFSRTDWLTLERARETIESLFSEYTTLLENGSGVCISYSGCLIVPTGDSEFKRIQITLNIKEWKVSI